jgi:hypothetical protein
VVCGFEGAAAGDLGSALCRLQTAALHWHWHATATATGTGCWWHHWLLVAGGWPLATGHLATGHWASSATGHWPPLPLPHSALLPLAAAAGCGLRLCSALAAGGGPVGGRRAVLLLLPAAARAASSYQLPGAWGPGPEGRGGGRTAFWATPFLFCFWTRVCCAAVLPELPSLPCSLRPGSGSWQVVK